MAVAADFFADARIRMVDSQIRPNKVTDPRILHAMRTLPREQFLPQPLTPLVPGDPEPELLQPHRRPCLPGPHRLPA